MNKRFAFQRGGLLLCRTLIASLLGFWLAVFSDTSCAQITLVASNAATNQIALGQTYLQDFNSLPSTGSATWSNNSTLRGWYANFTHGQVSVGQMVASNAVSLSAVTTGANGTANTLNSLGGSGSTNRAFGGTPGTHPDSGDSVNVVLRIKNASGGVLKGLKVQYDTLATSSSRTNGVSLAYRVFPAGTGAITNRFIETHRYTNSYNGATNESKRTEFGRIVTSTNGWTCVQKDVPQTKADQTFVLRDLDVPPNDEVWIAWHISQEDSGVTTLGIDNVRVGEFLVSRPGLPFIFQHPRQLAVMSGGTRGFKLDVGAAGSLAVSYQWRRNGTNISGATNSVLDYSGVSTAGSTHEGVYDVVVSNTGGSVISQPAKVNFYGKYAITTNSDVDFAALSSSRSNLRAATGGTLADVYFPTNMLSASYTNKVPVVVIIHGGGGNNGDKLDAREVQAGQEIAQRGWIAVAINYAMSSSSEQCWPYNVWDAKQAVRWLRQKAATGSTSYAFIKNIDTNRIGALGFSWGCNMGSMLAMTDLSDDTGVTTTSLKVNPTSGNSYDSYSSAVKCSAVFYGACDLPNYHQMNQFLNYTAWDNRTLYRRASPVNYIRKTAAPMMIVHGSADDDVWQSQTETLYQQQRSVGAELEPYLVVPGGEHSFYLFETSRINSSFPSPVDVRPETLGFFEKYLVDDVRRPAIHFEPVSQIAATGGSATFSVEARGTPTPTYQWRKDGVNLAGQTSASLALSSVTSANGGWYDVVVSNSEGTVISAAALLAVTGDTPPADIPVSVLAAPISQIISLGQTASFSVLATGTAPITYQWRKDGVNLAGQTTDTLVIANAGVGDAGTYDVICSNVANGTTTTITSASATLTIVPTQAIELVETSQAGNQITFSSGYSQSFGALPGTTTNLTNWVNESTLPGWSVAKHVYGTNAAGATNSTNYSPITALTGAVTNVSVNAGTWYSMDNSIGYCPSTGAGPGFLVLRIANQSLTNLTGLSLVWDLRNGGSRAGANASNVVSVSYLVVSNGTSLNMSNASSYPPSFLSNPAVVINGWKLVTNLVDKTLPGPANISNALTGLEVAPGDEIRIGWHLAKVGGSNSISAVDNVRIQEMASGAIGFDKAPVITAPPTNQLVPLGAVVQFKASVEARPAPRFQWYRNGNPLTEQNTDRYGIPEVRVADAGTYTLVASNSLGTTTAAATLAVADTSRTNVEVSSNNQAISFDLSTVSNAYSSWYNYGLIPGMAAYNITNTGAIPILFTNYVNWPGTFNTGTLVLANTTNGLAIGGVGSSTKSQMLVFRMANRSAGLVKGFRVNFTPLALTNTSTNLNPPNLQATLAASYKVLDATNTDTNEANFPPNFASTSAVATNNWVPLTNVLASSNVIIPTAISKSVTGVNILPDQEIWVGFYLAKPNGDTHFLGVKDVSVDQFSVQSLTKPLPTITFTNPGTLTYGQSVSLSASSTGGGTPTYSVVSGGGSIAGNSLSATSGTGSVVVRAEFAETADYSANSADITVPLAKAAQTITFVLDPPSATVGDSPRTLIATSSSGLTVSCASSAPAVASVSGNTLSFNTGGTATITATQAGNANYEAAIPVSQVVSVTGASVFTFSPGDLAIVACNAGTDAFAVLALVDIPAGATFRVTDYGWLLTGGFYTGSTEGVVSYTAPSGGVAKGTVLKWTTGAAAPWSQTTGFNFASGGDQLIIYQGPTPTGVPTADRLVYALQSKGGWAANATSSATSAEPTVGGGDLTSGVTAVTVPGNTSGYYIGPTSGDKNYLLAEIAKLSNWVSGAGDYANTLWVGSFVTTSFASAFGGAGATSDADGDGVPALLEYVMGGSGSGNDASRLPSAVMNGPNMEMTMVERINDASITKVAEVSSDLGAWSSAGVTRTVAPDQTGVPTGFQRVTYSVTPPNSSRAFMRMRVTQQP